MSDPGALPQDAPQPVQPAYTPPSLDILKKMFDDARQLTQEARRESCIDRDYYDGHQLTAAEISVLTGRGQPPLIINRIRRGVDGIMGVVVQGKTDPRALMRNPPKEGDSGSPQQQSQDPTQGMMGHNAGPPIAKPELDAGDVASMTLRFISDSNNFPAIKMDVLENMLIEGTGASLVEFVDGDVKITQVRWEDYFHDPRARYADLSDKRYDGVAKWMYADQVALIYPEFKQALLDCANGSGSAFGAYDASWEDRPENPLPWVDSRQRRLMMVEMYHLEQGQWMRCIFCAAGVLEYTPSPYKNDKGNTVNPIEAVSAYVDRQNRRYGVVRDMRGPQDEINMRRSKLLHLLNSRKVQQVDPNAPPVDADTARAEAARPDGVIPPGWQAVPSTEQIAGQAELLAEAKSEIERMGPNPAILGRQGADASGRAQQVRQQAGLTELARVLGRFTDWDTRVNKQMWNRARQFYTDPKWVRVTDDIGAPQYVRINEPTAPQMVTDPATGQQMMQPGPPKNHIAQMDVDIVVDSVPDTASLQQEVFAEFMQLAQINPQAYPPKFLIQISPLPEKQKLLKALEGAQAEAAQAAAPQMQMAAAEKTADINKTNSETVKNLADAKSKEVGAVTDAMHGHMIAAGHVPPPGAVPQGADTGVAVQ
jgi:hypothetical protein